ncbi:hypothetical protein ACFOUP_05620 [Belliella kenyensis]|uniref:ABC transporter permease n=2 Tax=Belliella kenyensis TaxID=1472724 RepID=A0ABV8EKF9_9BACT|nr:hypothetical protein [Belliella kenyensis]MCH7402773.1 hypothetical protein [Belliella kenyensis]
MNNLSISRILKLIKFEFLMHRRFYKMLLLAAFLIVFAILLYTMRKKAAFTNDDWEDRLYTSTYYFYMIGAMFLIVGQSFMDLRSKMEIDRYLLLPASNIERLLSQIIVKFGILFLIMPLIFFGAAILSRLVSTEIFYPMVKGYEKIESIRLETLWPLKPGRPVAYYMFVLGILFFIPSILFTGSLYFGKWNVVLTPLFILLIVMATVYSSLLIYRVFYYNYIRLGDFLDVSAEVRFFGEDIPVLILILMPIFYTGSVFSFIIAYHRLKEREI